MQNLMMFKKWFFSTCQFGHKFLLISLLGFANFVHAQSFSDYPNKPIKLVIPFPAGGSSDGIGRQVADKLSSVLKQTVVVENKGGQVASLVQMLWPRPLPMATPWYW